jgi:dolichol-phosphate mannosyltransferase
VTRVEEKNTSIFGLIMWSGFHQTFVPYHRRARQRGASRWTLGKKLKLFVDSFVSFSFFPIRLVSYLGLLVSALGFFYAAVVAVRRFFYATPVEGWSSIMVAVVTLSGLQLLMLGIVAEYLWRTFDESRKRPPYIIKETIGFDKRI